RDSTQRQARRVIQAFGQPEIAHMRLAGRIEQDISWFDIAMDNRALMSVMNGMRNPGQERGGLTIRQRLGSLETIRERTAFHELHAVKWAAIERAHLIDR